MTLAQIELLALRQLDEDPQDIGEYETVFRAYANMGYGIAMREYLKPRAMRTLTTDENGRAALDGDITRVVRVTDEAGMPVRFRADGMGHAIVTDERERGLSALCEVIYPQMCRETDEPMLPEDFHAALADYICYRHLSSGSLAKQSRAKFFQDSFYRRMSALRAEGMGSVTRFSGLYEMSDVRMGR